MTEFKRQIEGPALGNIPGVRATRPSARGEGLFQALGTAVQLGVKAKARSSAQESAKEIRGAEETAVSVEEAVSGVEEDVLLQPPVTEEFTLAHLTDIKKEKFDKVLTTQKRLRSAVDRGLISSTEAEARLAMLRNEALSDPFVAMYQEEFDRKLYPTSQGGRVFQATMAEKQAASAKKGDLEGTEAYSKLVTEIKLKNNVSEATAKKIIKDNEDRAIKRQELELASQQLSYNNEVFAARGDALSLDVASGYAGFLNEVVSAGKETGSTVEVSKLAVVKMEAMHQQALRNLQKMRINKEGVVVGKDATYDSTVAQLEKLHTRYKDLITKDFSQVQKFKELLDEHQGKEKLEDQISLSTFYAQFGNVYSAMLRSNNPAVSQYALDNLSEFDSTKNKFLAATDPLIQAINDSNNNNATFKQRAEALETEHTEAYKKETNPAKDRVTLSNYATVVTGKNGVKLVLDRYETSDPAEVDLRLLRTPVNLRDLKNNKEWMSSIKTDEKVKRAATQFLKGAAIRAKQVQAVESELSMDLTPTFLPGSPGSLSFNTTVPGVPDSVRVVPAEAEFGGGRIPKTRTRGYKIESGGVSLNDQFKEAVVNAFEIGAANEDLWNSEFDSVDDWINFLFTPMNAPTPSKTNEGEK